MLPGGVRLLLLASGFWMLLLCSAVRVNGQEAPAAHHRKQLASLKKACSLCEKEKCANFRGYTDVPNSAKCNSKGTLRTAMCWLDDCGTSGPCDDSLGYPGGKSGACKCQKGWKGATCTESTKETTKAPSTTRQRTATNTQTLTRTTTTTRTPTATATTTRTTTMTTTTTTGASTTAQATTVAPSLTTGTVTATPTTTTTGTVTVTPTSTPTGTLTDTMTATATTTTTDTASVPLAPTTTTTATKSVTATDTNTTTTASTFTNTSTQTATVVITDTETTTTTTTATAEPGAPPLTVTVTATTTTTTPAPTEPLTENITCSETTCKQLESAPITAGSGFSMDNVQSKQVVIDANPVVRRVGKLEDNATVESFIAGTREQYVATLPVRFGIFTSAFSYFFSRFVDFATDLLSRKYLVQAEYSIPIIESRVESLQVTLAFAMDVASLPVTYSGSTNKSAHVAFLNKYGTHVATRVVRGVRLLSTNSSSRCANVRDELERRALLMLDYVESRGLSAEAGGDLFIGAVYGGPALSFLYDNGLEAWLTNVHAANALVLQVDVEPIFSRTFIPDERVASALSEAVDDLKPYELPSISLRRCASASMSTLLTVMALATILLI